MDPLIGTDQIAVQAAGASDLLLLLVPGFPLVGALLLACCLGRDHRIHSLLAYLATAFASASFVVSCLLFQKIRTGSSMLSAYLWQWFSVGELQVEFAFSFDALSAVMALVVTGVGSLIHLYAIGYMREDEDRPRFFCYLNLFLFSMLILVLADNLLLMFVGWEGVGLCSYLLIGFWHKDMLNAKAGQKAFVVNRIGDAGFLLGIFVLFWATKSIQFEELGHVLRGVPTEVLEISALLLFIGAVGKSAQIPLYVWLPDAMAGPTPVSALIHAATMVTAGVYMISRLAPLFELAPMTSLLILVLGTATAFFAATIALAQNDIKKVLAYSTVSQLGYMFMALGASAYSSGIYHVVTHAFFKACLFMAAGSVIVGCHHEQDMRRFGGLWGKMTMTFCAYLGATYAIVGLPWGSGFFSKDGILWSVYSNSGLSSSIILFGGFSLAQVLWAIALSTAFLTAVYMTRSLVLTFFGEYRGDHPPHESEWTMLVPLAVLVIFSLLFGGLYGERLVHFLGSWTRTDLLVSHELLAKNETYHLLEMITTGVVFAGVIFSFVLYSVGQGVLGSLSRIFSWLHRALINKWWIDELYEAVVIKPLHALSLGLYHGADASGIDAVVNGTGMVVAANGELLRRLHTGRIGSYVMILFAGTLAILVFWMLL